MRPCRNRDCDNWVEWPKRYCDRPECQKKARASIARLGRNRKRKAPPIIQLQIGRSGRRVEPERLSLDEAREITKGWDPAEKASFEIAYFLKTLDEGVDERRPLPALWIWSAPRIKSILGRLVIVVFPAENNTQLAARVERVSKGRHRISRTAIKQHRDEWRRLLLVDGEEARAKMGCAYAGRGVFTKIIRVAILAFPKDNDCQLARRMPNGPSRQAIAKQRKELARLLGG